MIKEFIGKSYETEQDKKNILKNYDDYEKRKLIYLNEMYKEADKCIFASSFNVNLNTVIGYKKGNEKYTFMDDYDM